MIQRNTVTQVGVLLGMADSCRRLLLRACWVLQGVSKIYCVSVVTAWGPARKPPPPPAVGSATLCKAANFREGLLCKLHLLQLVRSGSNTVRTSLFNCQLNSENVNIILLLQ